MNTEAQRIAIAEACRWRWIETGRLATPERGYWVRPSGTSLPATGYINSSEKTSLLPDYPSDLNACHVMEKEIMGRLESQMYQDHLRALTKNNLEPYAWHANAAQRAEAFLRTLNLWKE